MTYFIQPIITDTASKEVVYATTNREALTFTRLALGSGRATQSIETLTQIQQVIQSIPATQSISSDKTIKVLGRLDNKHLTKEIHVTEIGVFAKVGNRPEFLFMYTSAETGDIIPSKESGSMIRTYEFNTTVSNDGKLTVNYESGDKVYASLLELGAIKTVVNTYTEKVNAVGEALTQHTADSETHISETERQLWNAKANTMTASGVTDGLMSAEDKNKLDGIETGATKYIHPPTHPATMITENTSRRFVSDAEKASWNRKAETTDITKDRVGLGQVANYGIATTAEAQAGQLNNKYMTPLSTKFLIDSISKQGIGTKHSGSAYNLELGAGGMSSDGEIRSKGHLNATGISTFSGMVRQTSNGVTYHQNMGSLTLHSNSNRGTIVLTLPNQNIMFSATVSIRSYRYVGTIEVAGYTYLDSQGWYVPHAYGNVSGDDFSVRFRSAGKARYITFGETTTEWGGFLQVTVENVKVGFGGPLANRIGVGLSTVWPGSTEESRIPIGKLFNRSSDGHGSGLDADLLDGLHASHFATKAELNQLSVIIGSNANGSFNKFQDGTLICHGRATAQATAGGNARVTNVLATFPHGFIGTPVLSTGVTVDRGNAINQAPTVNQRSLSASSVLFDAVDMGPTPTAISNWTICYIAIGRWK